MKLFTLKAVPCTINGASITVVNCKHWSYDSNKCHVNCAISEINNPAPWDCAKCKKRSPLDNPNITSKKQEIKEESKDPSFAEKTKNYIKAEMSQAVSGKVSKEIFEKRKDICMNCEYRVPSAGAAKDPIGWCKGGCGCSVGNPRAALSQKLYMPSLSCPRGKFGVEEGQGFNVKDATDSLKGIVKSVKNLFEEKKNS